MGRRGMDKHKKVKVTALLLAVVMLSTVLSGCMAYVYNASINADGTGTVVAQSGYTYEGAMAYQEYTGDTGSLEDFCKAQEWTKFSYNGKDIYGEETTTTCTDIEQMVKALNKDITDPQNNGFELTKNWAGITLEFRATPNMAQDSVGEMPEGALEDWSDEELQELYNTLLFAYVIQFPAPVRQVSGSTTGITIDSNKLTMDLAAMSKDIKEPTVYRFTTDPNALVDGAPVDVAKVFSDVDEEDWFFAAVSKLAEGGLVNGVGDGRFEPARMMSYAQFCQILAKAKGMDSGTKSNYWAGKSIDSCVAAGYVPVLGVGVEEYYKFEVPITREAAVSAMYKAKQAELTTVVHEYSAADIPDYSKISAQYQSDVLNAYRYGITTGVNASRTFEPQGQLTRGQVCQLFYNLNWVAPIEEIDW